MSDTLVYGIGQLLSMRADVHGPLRGRQMAKAEVLEQAAIYIKDGVIVAVGSTGALEAAYAHASEKVDAKGRMVSPGLVDPHTHLVHAGSRENELAQKVAGVPYLDILAAGGGILSTVPFHACSVTRRTGCKGARQSAPDERARCNNGRSEERLWPRLAD